MSSDQSINAETVEQTKQQIRGLVSEIAQLSKSDLAAEEYYAAFLQRVVSALAAIGGAIWTLGESRKLELSYQINLSEALLQPSSADAVRHMRLLGELMRQGEPQLVPPQSGTGEEDAAGNPTNYLLVLVPLHMDGRVEGVVEVFQRSDSQPATQRGYLRFLVQMCELAGEWLKSRKLRHFSDRHSLWAQADQFSRMVHEGLDVRETSYVIVNEGRRMIGCDRVSVALKKGRACKVEAVSGQDTIENRSNIVNALSKLATRVVATGEPLWYTGATDDLPPQVEEALDVYVDESYAKSVTVLPLRRPARPDQQPQEGRAGETTAADSSDREVIGALIVEQIETDLPRELVESRVDLVYEHSTRALSNSLDHHNLFLMPVWKTIGSSRMLVRARTLPKTVIVAVIILLVLIGLFGLRKDFNLESRGALQPILRQDVFFDISGTVTEILVKDGDNVKQGAELIRMVNYDLEQDWQRVLGELNETSKRLEGLRKQIMSGRLPPAQQAQVSSDYLQFDLRRKSLETQLELIDEKRKLLVVTSPIDGQVMLPWDAEQSMLHRPVMAGQMVMTVANPDGPWELILEMPERRMGHIMKARDTIKKQDPSKDLPVSFILATDPGNRRYGQMEHIGRGTQVKGEDGPTIKIKVTIDKNDLFEPRPGATVTADVKCGRSSVFYAWFHEAYEWFQRKVLF